MRPMRRKQRNWMVAQRWSVSSLHYFLILWLVTSSSECSDDRGYFYRNQHCILCIALLFYWKPCWNLLMENSLLEILTYYVIGGALLIGAPGVFFFIVFQPALQNTKGRMVGYKDHKTYGDSSIYENSPSDQSKFYLTLESWTNAQNVLTVGQQWLASWLLSVVTLPLVKLFQAYGERYVNHFNVSHRRVYLCCPIEWGRRWWWQRTW